MIVDKFIGQLNEQIQDRNVKIVIDDNAAEWLQKRGYKPEFGAREMSRVIHKHIKQPLADLMLFGELQHGGIAHVKTSEVDDKTELIIVAEASPSTEEEEVLTEQKDANQDKNETVPVVADNSTTLED